MSEVAAEARFVLHADGKTIPVEVRRIGKEIAAAGDKAGKDYADGFARRVTPQMRDTADRLGTLLNGKLRLDDDVLRRNSLAIRTFGRDGETALSRLGNQLFAFGVIAEDSIRKSFGDGGRVRKFWDDLDAGSGKLHGLNLSWRDLSHNTRQWTLIIGAALAGMQDLAVLSSAVGAGLFAVGGALSAAVLGGAGMVAVFGTLSRDVAELPPGMRDVAVQFRNLGKEFLNARDIISSAAFAQMPNTFDRLSGTVRALSPELSQLGTAVGRVMDDFSLGLEEGTEGFEELRQLIGNAADDFPALASATGTWATALLRGLNRANPLTDQLIGYVDKLGDRFDRFTRSNAFDQWVAQSSTTFKRLGELLDATGRALNDLVTPASVARTQAFLGNLTGFMPNLSRLLDIIGRLDVFGLAAQALNDMGEALSPLAGPAGELADSLNEVASIIIDRLGVALGIVADLAAPLAQGLANVVDAIPPDVLAAIAAGVIAVAAAFTVLKGAQGISGAIGAIEVFSGWAGRAETATGKLAGALKSGLGKAGVAGLVIVGVLGIVEALKDMAWEMSGIESAARDAIASNANFASSITRINEAWSPLAGEMTNDWDTILADLKGFDSFWSGFNPDFGDLGSKSKGLFEDLSNLTRALNAMDPALATLASQNLPAATGQFSAWAREIGATDDQVLEILNRMPEFKAQLEATAVATDGVATSADIVALALGEAKFATQDNTAALDLLGSSAVLTGAEVDTLAAKIMGFGSANLTTRDAARQFEEAVDGITEALAANGATLDITNAAGRANEATIDRLATSTLNYAASVVQQTGDQQAANAVIADGRQRLIEMLAQFGITGAEADAYADKLGLIPADVKTDVGLEGADAAEQRLNEIARNRSMVIRVTTSGVVKVGNKELTPFASGGNVFGPTRALIGEAGPEAVVPLNRPLSQVNPEVRWLSAIAQGKGPVPMAAGGVAGGGREVIFEAGAIVVQGAEDPRATAFEVADEVAERIGS